MRKTTKSVQRPNPKYRTTFDSAMPLNYIASHYPDVRKCKSGISNPRPGLTPGTALRAVGSGIRNTCMQQPLALVSKQLYFPNMKYLKIVVIFTLSIFLQKKCENNEKIMSFNYKIYNLHSFLVSNTINMLI